MANLEQAKRASIRVGNLTQEGLNCPNVIFDYDVFMEEDEDAPGQFRCSLIALAIVGIYGNPEAAYKEYSLWLESMGIDLEGSDCPEMDIEFQDLAGVQLLGVPLELSREINRQLDYNGLNLVEIIVALRSGKLVIDEKFFTTMEEDFCRYRQELAPAGIQDWLAELDNESSEDLSGYCADEQTAQRPSWLARVGSWIMSFLRMERSS